ncbi:MAG TPA: hypothetical protein VFK82_10775, partial [Burkholderiaceae bacterium]|nr:hypothetical protein [Burkholderiaceae bacterium]
WIFFVIPMIVANILMHLVEDKHLFSDEEQRELLERLRRMETHLDLQASSPAAPSATTPGTPGRESPVERTGT